MQDFNFPYAKDKAENKSSATLFFAYISFWLVLILICIIGFQMQTVLYALIAGFILFLICIFFYRARRIDTLKLSRNGFEVGDGEVNGSTTNSSVVSDKSDTQVKSSWSANANK